MPLDFRSSGWVRLRTLLFVLSLTSLVLLGTVVPSAAEPIVAAVIHEVDVAGPEGTQPFASAGPVDAGMVTATPQDTPPFAMIGLSMAEGQDAWVRTASGDGDWSTWLAMEVQTDEGPDAGSPENVTEPGRQRSHPVFTGEADRIQVRTGGGDVTDVRAYLIDPYGLDRSWSQRAADALGTAWHGSPRSQAQAMAGMPAVVTRAEWGANESIVTQPTAYARNVDRLFVHHTVGSNAYSQAQAAGVVRGVQAYHVNGNGWNDIGYNFLVDRFGTIYEGRAGGMDRAVIGAQAGGFNTFSTGVALLGTYTTATPASAMVAAVQRIAAWKADVHHFNPLGTSQATSAGSSRYPEGVVVTLPNIAGHRDVSTTTCPGNAPYGMLDAIRDAVRQEAGDLIVDHGSDIVSTRVIRGEPDAASIAFTAALDPPGEWTLTVRDPAGAVMHRATGDGPVVEADMPTQAGGFGPGTYTWTVEAAGRRPAVETLEMTRPVIQGAETSSVLATANREGQLDPPVAFGATLWRDATWQLEIRNPAGILVHQQNGQADRLDAGWFDGVDDPGTYDWQMTAEDADPVSGTIEGHYDLLDRLADTDDPVWAAALVSAATFAEGSATHAVIARQDVFADALAGGPLAGSEGPLLLTGSDRLDERVADELGRVLAPGAQIFVLGGTRAISDGVAGELAAHGDVRRLSGPSRFATAAAVAAEVVAGSGTREAMIARAGPDDAAPWADALAGGAFGAAAGIPVLLTDTGSLSTETAQALVDLSITSTIVLGGTAAVDDAVLAGLPSPVRLSGADRTATAAAVAVRLWGRVGPVEQILLANGYGDTAWAWALAAAPLAARRNAALLLTTPTHLADPTAATLGDLPVTGGSIVGSPNLVADEVGYTASDAIRR